MSNNIGVSVEIITRVDENNILDEITIYNISKDGVFRESTRDPSKVNSLVAGLTFKEGTVVMAATPAETSVATRPEVRTASSPKLKPQR